MNYYDARQHSLTERWSYTCRNGKDIWPVGTCAEDGGHESEQDARDCYRAFLLQKIDLNLVLPEPRLCCAADCIATTERAAQCDRHMFALCDLHMSDDQVRILFPTVGSIISSY